MSAESEESKPSKLWKPPEQFKANGIPDELAPLVVLGTIAWTIAGFFQWLWRSINRKLK